MEAVKDPPNVESYHTLKEPLLLMAVEIASNLETAFDSLVPADDGDVHFTEIRWKKILEIAAPFTADGVIGAALLMLEDLNMFQAPVAFSDNKPSRVYVRRIPSTGRLTTTATCAPMFSHDVRAICATVDRDNVAAVNQLTRFGLAEIRRWRKSGVKARREDVRRVFLGILDDYARAGCSLAGVPLSRKDSVAKAAEEATVRRAFIGDAWFDLLEKVKAIQTLRNPVVERKIEIPEGITASEHALAPEPEQPILKIVEEGLKLHAAGRLCENCKKNDSKGRRLCEECEDALISQSGVVQLTKDDIPEFNDKGLTGAIMPVIGRAAFDAGIVEKDDYDYVAEQVNNLVATFDQYDLEMDEAGIFIKGINLTDDPVKAEHRDARSADGVVVAAGMEFRPHMIRHLVSQIDQIVREVTGMYIEPLLERAVNPEDQLGSALRSSGKKTMRMLKSRLGLLQSVADELGAEIVEGDLEDRAENF
jgi:hypothetical protein